MGRIKTLIDEFGMGLLISRAPRVLWRALRTKLATSYWKLFLGSCGQNVIISPGVRFHRPRNVRLGDHVVISENVTFGSENPRGTLVIGDHVQINRCCSIDHSGDTTIGSGTLISEGTHILSHSHGFNPRQQSVDIPKVIGKNCWIGFRSVIGETATLIEHDVIIATASVVVRSCDKTYSVYGGVPAKWIKSLEA
jgi:acetyltransferase-like isoleucine patch superfamily enzyme